MRNLRTSLLLSIASLIVTVPAAAGFVASDALGSSPRAQDEAPPPGQAKQQGNQKREQNQKGKQAGKGSQKANEKRAGKDQQRADGEQADPVRQDSKGRRAAEQDPPKAATDATGKAVPARKGASREDPRGALPKAFARFDLNGDGRLGPAETRAAQEALDPKVSPEGLGAAKKNGASAGKAAGEAGASQGSPKTDTGSRVSSSKGLDSSTRLQAAKEAVAKERARREAQVADSADRVQKKSSLREPKKSSLAIYRSLSKYQPKAPTKSTGGWAPMNRQGVTRGKKRGSTYYREQISRGSRRGRGGRGRNNRNNRNNGTIY